MSEYQYYEFVSVDQPLTVAQQAELRALSTRARITSSGFVNHYEWGDLKGDPRAWMERYFDGFLYLANWGTHRITLRWPRRAVDAEVVAGYCVGEPARSWATGTHVFVDLASEDEDGDEEYDGGGLLAPIIPVRAEVAGGDRRLLYLAWLLCVQDRELDDDEPEPPVPAGLGELSAPLAAVADFLRIDTDLLAVAAEASPALVKAPSEAALRRWVTVLPPADQEELLLRLLRADDGSVRAETLRRIQGPAGDRATGTRTAGQLLAGAEARWAERQRLDRERQMAERKRREAAVALAREQRLDALAGRQEEAWQQVDALIETKKPREYDAAIVLLADLKALAERDDATAAFRLRLGELRERHVRKASLLDRFDRARLD